jgi:hypothetical protein
VNRFHKMADKSARKSWGVGWSKLTDDLREALLAREAMMLLLGQCDTMAKYAPAKALLRMAMGWQQDAEPAADLSDEPDDLDRDEREALQQVADRIANCLREVGVEACEPRDDDHSDSLLRQARILKNLLGSLHTRIGY